MKSETISNIISIIVAVMSVIIAGAALVISVNESKYNRQHNALSVRPVLAIDSDVDNISVRNGGLGPAFIDSVIIETKDGLYLGSNQLQAWDSSLVNSAKKKNIPLEGISYERTRIDAIIEANKKYELLKFKNCPNDSIVEVILDAIITNVKINIYFHSAYNEQFNLNWVDGTNYFNDIYVIEFEEN